MLEDSRAFLRRKGLTREILYCITTNFAASYEITALASKKAEFSRFSPAENCSAILLPESVIRLPFGKLKHIFLSF